MSRNKRKKGRPTVYVDDGGEVIAAGPATVNVAPDGTETIEYLSPGRRLEKHTSSPPINSTEPPLPSLMSTLGGVAMDDMPLQAEIEALASEPPPRENEARPLRTATVSWASFSVGSSRC